MGQISLWDVQSGSKLRDLTSSPMGSFTAPDNQTRPDADHAKHGRHRRNDDQHNRHDVRGNDGPNGHIARVQWDGRTLATGGVESKTNIDIAAMMSGAMNQRPQKRFEERFEASRSDDLMKDL